MRHYFVDVAGRDRRLRTCFLTTDYQQATALARILAVGNVPSVIRMLDLTGEQASMCWYRMGVRQPGLNPPARFRYAYALGRRTAEMKGEGDPAKGGTGRI